LHRLEVRGCGPLRVVDDVLAVVAAMDVGRHEPGLLLHHLVGGAHQQVDELLLPLGRHGEDVDQGHDVLVRADRRGHRPIVAAPTDTDSQPLARPSAT
jgi:hypothetical protein